MPRCETLPNGLRVVLVPCEAESVAVGFFIASGSRHETKGGISHFIEHMLFKGTPTRRPIDITRAIEGRGGNFNACTGEESTCYYTHMPREYLGESVDILSDMYLNATMPADEFAREKQVIVEEIRMYDDEPDQVAMANLQRALFPGSRLGLPVAGSARTLAPLRPRDLLSHMRSHYLPGNTAVVIVGDFDDDKALSAIMHAMGRFRRRVIGKDWLDDPNARRPDAEVSVTRDVAQAQLALGYRMFGISDRRKYAATVMDAVLGRGMSSRLFQEVREKRGLSYDISSQVNLFDDTGMFTVTAGLDAARCSETLRTIERELDRIREKPVSGAELRRTKEFLIGNFRLSHERVTAKMFFYGQTLLKFNRLIMPEEQVEGVWSVGANELRAVANAVFRPMNRSVSWVLPSQRK